MDISLITVSGSPYDIVMLFGFAYFFHAARKT